MLGVRRDSLRCVTQIEAARAHGDENECLLAARNVRLLAFLVQHMLCDLLLSVLALEHEQMQLC